MKIHTMLPFLDTEEINKLIDESVEKKVNLTLLELLPYADEKKIGEVLERAFADDSIIVYVQHLLPFLNKVQMARLYEAYQEGLIVEKSCTKDELIPYLCKENIKDMFEKQLVKLKEEMKLNLNKAKKEIENEKEEKEEK